MVRVGQQRIRRIIGLVYVLRKIGVREMSSVVIRCCDTCSRTFYCRSPKKYVCESWGPDIYAEAELAAGAELVDRIDIQEDHDVG